MTFSIKVTSNHGTSHPIAARMLFQSSELIKWADISQEKQENILSIIYVLQRRLLKCDDLYAKLANAFVETVEKNMESSDSRVKYVPHVIGLENDIETILYEWKNFLRDLLGVINIFFDTKFDSASAFCLSKNKQDGKLSKWAAREFGADSSFTQMLKSEQTWIGEVVRKRNAVEHPSGHSGVLFITNFELLPDGKVMIPTWRCDDAQPTSIFQDIEITIDNLLTLTEDILVNCILQKNKFGDLVAFAEIPEGERSENCPIRIRVVPGQRMVEQLPKTSS